MRESPFHPELRKSASRIPQFSFGPALTKAAVFLQNLGPTKIPVVEGVAIEDFHTVGVDGNPIRMRVYRPAEPKGPCPAILWTHGGGFIIGKPEHSEAFSIEMCRTLSYVVVAVQYRLASIQSFPAPMEDSYSALVWLRDNAPMLGIDTSRIAVGGNSAGAGLAAGLAQLALDRRDVRLNFQLLIYPMLDDRTVLRRDIDGKVLRLWTQKSNRYGWTKYLGQEPGSDGVSPYAAPARRKDLAGLPPAWIGVGTCDLFHDEDVEYARRLTEAGVSCELVIVPGAFHGFEIAGEDKAVVREFRQASLDALGRSGPIEV